MVASRRPRSRSVMNGGPYTGAVTTLSPPRTTEREALRAWSSKVAGVLATVSRMKSRSNLTRMSSIFIPALPKIHGQAMNILEEIGVDFLEDVHRLPVDR